MRLCKVSLLKIIQVQARTLCGPDSGGEARLGFRRRCLCRMVNTTHHPAVRVLASRLAARLAAAAKGDSIGISPAPSLWQRLWGPGWPCGPRANCTKIEESDRSLKGGSWCRHTRTATAVKTDMETKCPFGMCRCGDNTSCW